MFKGSLYGQWEAIVTFTVMIVLADQEGEVDMTPEALAAATSIPLDIIRKGIALLEQPDPQSRTPDEEGRRIVRVSDSRDWGWTITNHAHYRAIRTAEERREYFKQHKRKQRAKKSTPVNQSPPLSTKSPQSPPIAVSRKQEAGSSKQGEKAPPRRSTGEAALLLAQLRSLSESRDTPAQGVVRFIRRENVLEMGPEIVLAYDAVGGADRILNATGKEISFLTREFADALESARQ